MKLQKVLFFFIFFLIITNTSFAAKVYMLNNDKLLAVAKSLPGKGVLNQENSFVYLKVSDDYIKKLLPLINEPKLKANNNMLGAHISVISPKEDENRTLEPFFKAKLSNVYYFTATALKEIKHTHCIKGNYGIRTHYALVVDAPTLIKLRQEAGLSQFPSYTFHILIGYKQKTFYGKPCIYQKPTG